MKTKITVKRNYKYAIKSTMLNLIDDLYHNGLFGWRRKRFLRNWKNRGNK